MITLETLTWSNLFSYADNNVIKLTSDPIVQLVGLNGHGKSSIPLVLEETLFNKNSKGIKKGDLPNRLLDTTKYNAECTFTIDDKMYVLSIARSGATQKVKLLENGVDISSHTATGTFEQVQELLGLDFKTFSQLVYQNSNSSLQFLTATDANRKKFLIDLLSLDRYLVIFDRIKAVHKEVYDTLLKLRGREEVIKSWLTDTSTKVLDEEPFVEVPSVDTDTTKKLVDLKTELAGIDEKNKRIASNNVYKTKLASIDSTNLVCSNVRVDTRELDVKLTECNQRINQELQTIENMNSLMNSRLAECPTCRQQINNDRINQIITDSRTRINVDYENQAALLKALSNAQINNKIVEAHQKLVSEFEKYSALVDYNLPDILLDKASLEESIRSLEVSLLSLNKKIDEASKHNSRVATHNAKVNAIKQQLTEYSAMIQGIKVELQELEGKLSKLEILKKAFSTSGLIAYKIENSVKELEEITNGYLAELSDGRFELLFALANDKLNVVIVDNGKDVDISALSAGELARVNISTLLAIRKLMASLSKSKINVLFLDEVIDVLDMDGKERLIEVLLKEQELNTFLISHSYSHPLVKKLQVVKTSGISRIDYGS